MTPLARAAVPGILMDHGPKWTRSFLERRQRYPNTTFDWPTVCGAKINKELVRVLCEMSARHCAYCDHFELGEGSQETIDHFRPKSRFPELAFDWANMYPACNQCQNHKLEKFTETVLAPDETAYTFDRYFVVDYRSGELQPNPAATKDDQRRAEDTITLFGLNRHPRPTCRMRQYQRYYSPSAPRRDCELDSLPYRFLEQRQR